MPAEHATLSKSQPPVCGESNGMPMQRRCGRVGQRRSERRFPPCIDLRCFSEQLPVAPCVAGFYNKLSMAGEVRTPLRARAACLAMVQQRVVQACEECAASFSIRPGCPGRSPCVLSALCDCTGLRFAAGPAGFRCEGQLSQPTRLSKQSMRQPRAPALAVRCWSKVAVSPGSMCADGTDCIGGVGANCNEPLDVLPPSAINPFWQRLHAMRG